MIGDMIIIWRVWAVWGRNYWVALVPLLLMLASAGRSLHLTYYIWSANRD